MMPCWSAQTKSSPGAPTTQSAQSCVSPSQSAKFWLADSTGERQCLYGTYTVQTLSLPSVMAFSRQVPLILNQRSSPWTSSEARQPDLERASVWRVLGKPATSPVRVKSAQSLRNGKFGDFPVENSATSQWKIRRFHSGKMGDFNLEKWEISEWENGRFCVIHGCA